MNIKQAILRSRLQILFGYSMLVSGYLFYFLTLVMMIYRLAVDLNNSSSVFNKVGYVLASIIASLYEATAPYIGFVWRNVPTLNHEDPLSSKNLALLGFLGLMITGKQLVLEGKRLRTRIKRHAQRLEELQWDQAMRESTVPSPSVFIKKIDRADFYQQVIPPSKEKDWWTRPWGGVGLAIVSGYSVAVLAKITGML